MTKRSTQSLQRRELKKGAKSHRALLLRLEAAHVGKHGEWKTTPGVAVYEDAIFTAAELEAVDPVEVARALQWARSVAVGENGRQT